MTASPRELDGDIIAYFTGDLDGEALAALDQRLREDPAAAARFAELSTREVLLSSVLRMRAGHPDHPSTRLRLVPAPKPRAARWRWGLAAAALLLISTMLAVVAARRDHATGTGADPLVAAHAIATVVDVGGSAEAQRDGRTTPLVPAAPIAAGDRIVVGEGSHLALAYADGTRLDLGPSTTLRMSAPGSDRLELEQGELDAAVTHRAAGKALVFSTSQARAEVIGTRLRLSVSSSATRLQVDEGRVRLTRLSDGAVAEIGSGHAATATADREAMFASVRSGSLADRLVLGTKTLFSTVFADSPEAWPDALGQPPGTPAGTVAVRTQSVAGGQRTYLGMHGPRHSGASPEPFPAGGRTCLSFRYVADHFASADLIEVVATDTGGQAYHVRLRPRFETLTTATISLDSGFTARLDTGGRRTLAAGTPLASYEWRVVHADGTPADADAQLWIEEVVGFEASGAVETTPLVAEGAPATGYHRAWDFDDGGPTDFTVLGGSWRHLASGGVGGSGCMETTSGRFGVAIDVQAPAVPVRITIEEGLCLPNTVGTYSVFVQWDSFRSLTQLLDIGKELDLPAPVEGAASEYTRVVEYLSGEHMEIRLQGERAALAFGEPAPGARLQLFVIGLNRLDRLRIDEIEAWQAPPVEDMRAAVAALPERTPGTTVAMPGFGPDPAHPARADFRLMTPGESPWMTPTKP